MGGPAALGRLVAAGWLLIRNDALLPRELSPLYGGWVDTLSRALRLLAGPGVADPLRVVVVTTFDVDEYVYGALRGGACGFLLKDSGPTLLAEAVRAAAVGDSLVSPSVKSAR